MKIKLQKNIGIACLVTALIMVPLYFHQLKGVEKHWSDIIKETEAAVTPTNDREEYMMAATIEALEEAKKAWKAATVFRAMEIELALVVAGTLLLLLRRKECDNGNA